MARQSFPETIDPVRGSNSQAFFERMGSGRLGWRSWLVLFGLGAAVVLIELRNHTLMWQQHGSGQTIWTDGELLWESFLYLLVFPLLGGLALKYIGRADRERERLAGELAVRRRLVTQMNEASDWSELAELIVRSPGEVVAAERAWLLARRDGNEEFGQVTHWQHATLGLFAPHHAVNPAVCESCEQATASQDRLARCSAPAPVEKGRPATRYCLSLSDGATRNARLLFDLPSDRVLAREERRMLADLADEMAMGIGNATLHHVQQQQLDVARDERLRIARDLHDTLGQNISYLRLKLEHLSTPRPDGPEPAIQDELAQMLPIAAEAYEQVRDTLEELRATEQLALDEAIRSYARPVAERAGFALSIRQQGAAGALSPKRARQLLYVVREGLNNVEKHAAATRVEIVLAWHSEHLKLVMKDDGVGFDPEQITMENRYGTSIMGERAQAMKGDLRIESLPGAGTTLTLSIPLSPHDRSAHGP